MVFCTHKLNLDRHIFPLPSTILWYISPRVIHHKILCKHTACGTVGCGGCSSIMVVAFLHTRLDILIMHVLSALRDPCCFLRIFYRSTIRDNPDLCKHSKRENVRVGRRRQQDLWLQRWWAFKDRIINILIHADKNGKIEFMNNENKNKN